MHEKTRAVSSMRLFNEGRNSELMNSSMGCLRLLAGEPSNRQSGGGELGEGRSLGEETLLLSWKVPLDAAAGDGGSGLQRATVQLVWLFARGATGGNAMKDEGGKASKWRWW